MKKSAAKKSAAVECSEEFRALRNTMEHWKTVAADFAKQVEVKNRQLETAFDESQNHCGDALASAAKATREALEWKRLADHWEKQWNASNAERGGNAMRVKELESEMDRMKREHSEEVARLEGDLRRVVSKRDFHYSQSEAFREIALAAVGVKP